MSMPLGYIDGINNPFSTMIKKKYNNISTSKTILSNVNNNINVNNTNKRSNNINTS